MLSLESNLLTDEWFCCVYFSIIILDEALLVFDWDLAGVRQLYYIDYNDQWQLAV